MFKEGNNATLFTTDSIFSYKRVYPYVMDKTTKEKIANCKPLERKTREAQNKKIK